MAAAIDLKREKPKSISVNRKFVLDNGLNISIQIEKIKVVPISGVGLHARKDGLFDLYHLTSSNRILKRMEEEQAVDFARVVPGFTWEHLRKVQAGIDETFSQIQGMEIQLFHPGLWQVCEKRPMSIPALHGEFRPRRARTGFPTKEKALIWRSQQVYSFYPEDCVADSTDQDF